MNADLVRENEELRKRVKQLEIALRLESEKCRRAWETETERCDTILDLERRLLNVCVAVLK
jgi:hypothetical protein